MYTDGWFQTYYNLAYTYLCVKNQEQAKAIAQAVIDNKTSVMHEVFRFCGNLEHCACARCSAKW